MNKDNLPHMYRYKLAMVTALVYGCYTPGNEGLAPSLVNDGDLCLMPFSEDTYILTEKGKDFAEIMAWILADDLLEMALLSQPELDAIIALDRPAKVEIKSTVLQGLAECFLVKDDQLTYLGKRIAKQLRYRKLTT